MPAENRGLPPPSRSDYPVTTEKSEQGAAATLGLYADSIHYAYATGDARPALEFIDGEQCINCAVYLQHALDAAEKGHYSVRPDLTYDDFYHEQANDGDIIVELPFQQGESWESRMGRRYKSSDPNSGTLHGKLHWNGSAWMLVDFADTIDEP